MYILQETNYPVQSMLIIDDITFLAEIHLYSSFHIHFVLNAGIKTGADRTILPSPGFRQSVGWVTSMVNSFNLYGSENILVASPTNTVAGSSETKSFSNFSGKLVRKY